MQENKIKRTYDLALFLDSWLCFFSSFCKSMASKVQFGDETDLVKLLSNDSFNNTAYSRTFPVNTLALPLKGLPEERRNVTTWPTCHKASAMGPLTRFQNGNSVLLAPF